MAHSIAPSNAPDGRRGVADWPATVDPAEPCPSAVGCPNNRYRLSQPSNHAPAGTTTANTPSSTAAWNDVPTIELISTSDTSDSSANQPYTIIARTPGGRPESGPRWAAGVVAAVSVASA